MDLLSIIVGDGAVGIWWSLEDVEMRWEPLEVFATGPEATAAGLVVDDFMWMAVVLLNTGVQMHMYKHSMTRRYLYLGVDNVTYFHERGYYVRDVRVVDAIERLAAVS